MYMISQIVYIGAAGSLARPARTGILVAAGSPSPVRRTRGSPTLPWRC